MKWILCFFSLQLFSGNLQELIRNAKPFEIVNVDSGVYREGMIVIDKPIILKGIGRPVIDGSKQKNVIKITSSNVIIEGFEIRASGYSDIAEYAGVRIENANNCIVRNNIFKENVYSVYLAKAENCLIENNDIHTVSNREATSGNGIHLWNSKNTKIVNNSIEGHRDGIYIEFSGDSWIKGNSVKHNIRYGLHFMYSHGNQYIENIFSENQTGVAVMYSKHVHMLKNRFEKSWGHASYGLLLKDITDSVISGNVFFGNTVAVLLDAANRNRFYNNTLEKNGWALRILGNSEENLFKRNQFISNFFEVTTNSEKSTNDFKNNFWSTYRGYDLDKDNIGDQPFRPMKIFGLWVAKFPELVVLLGSPIVEFLEIAERVLPILTPINLLDSAPLIRRPS